MSQLISVVTITLVAHRLGPDAFGIFSIIFVFTTLWAALTADPGLNLTVLQQAKDDPVLLVRLARTTLGMSYLYAPCIGVLMLASAWLTYGTERRRDDTPRSCADHPLHCDGHHKFVDDPDLPTGGTLQWITWIETSPPH